MAIGFLGDVMLGRGVAQVLSGTPPERLWSHELRAIAQSLDLTIANVECCLSTRGGPTQLVRGKPFFFRGPPSGALALEAMNVRVAGVANNHALDYGEQALRDTLHELGAAGMATAGAGLGDVEARRAAIVDHDGLRVGVMAVADHPREYAAAHGHWGIAFADLRQGVPGWLADEMRRLRDGCDVVIAFPHWGPNMTSEPAAWQRAVGRELQELGADLVAGHSSHCFHGVDWGIRGPILSDLGGALDDYRVDPVLRNDLGLLAVWQPATDELELIGITLDYARTDLARAEDADWIADRLTRASERLGVRVERVSEQRFKAVPEQA